MYLIKKKVFYSVIRIMWSVYWYSLNGDIVQVNEKWRWKEAKSNVDIMKFILSIMVFFVYSGYFFSCEDKLVKKDKLVKYSKHIVKLYILWSAIYLPICIQIYMENGWSIQECLHNYSEGFFQLGQHPYSWQLWYLWSLIFISIIIYIF